MIVVESNKELEEAKENVLEHVNMLEHGYSMSPKGQEDTKGVINRCEYAIRFPTLIDGAKEKANQDSGDSGNANYQIKLEYLVYELLNVIINIDK